MLFAYNKLSKYVIINGINVIAFLLFHVKLESGNISN